MILTLDQRSRRYLAGVAASGLFLASCGGGATTSVDAEAGTTVASSAETSEASDSAASDLTALATTSIWADVTSNALCGAEVESIIPLGADPHSWEPSIRVPEDIAAANLLVRNGLFLEERLMATLDAVEESATPTLSLASLVASEEDDDHDDHADHDDEADHDDHDDHADHDDEADHDDHGHPHHSGPDPHLWMDPTLVARAATLIADAAVEAGWPESVKDCAADYSGQLAALDEEIASQVSVVDVGDRVLVTNHDALGRFAERYGFTVLGTVLPATSTLAEANPADLTALADEILAAGVTTIFYDFQSSSVDAESLAERLDGVEVAALLTGSLVEDSEVGADYITMMQTNVQRILSAIEG
ncbi:MAG: metal ABC transporter substrate-binding protein [Ilumatobacteraceae bacterium]